MLLTSFSTYLVVVSARDDVDIRNGRMHGFVGNLTAAFDTKLATFPALSLIHI